MDMHSPPYSAGLRDTVEQIARQVGKPIWVHYRVASREIIITKEMNRESDWLTALGSIAEAANCRKSSISELPLSQID